MKALLFIVVCLMLACLVVRSQISGINAVSTPVFKYPANMTNYYWDLQKSSNAVDWVTVEKNLKGKPGGPMPYQLRPGEQVGQMYFRMKGHALPE